VNPEEYATMRCVEDDFWWYQGFRRIYGALLDRYCPEAAAGRVLDAGCGTGAFLSFLEDRYHPEAAVGLDMSQEALAFCSERGLPELTCCSVEELPFPDASFDLVASLDVLCHTSIPDDLVPLREFRRVLRPGGCVLLNLPAFQFMHSEHDLAVHTSHRYRRREVEEKLAAAGFEPVEVIYANVLLFPVVAAVRLAKKLLGPRTAEEAKSDLQPLPHAVNALLARMLGWEAGWIGRIRAPFGSSVTALGRAV
jgi:SAM-dependent methyltransferase